MGQKFKIKQNDRLPKLRLTVRDALGVVDVTTASAMKFFMTNTQTGVVKVNGATVGAVDAINGVVEYPWAVGDTDTPGKYRGEVEVTFAGGKETFPNNGYIYVEVVPEVG